MKSTKSKSAAKKAAPKVAKKAKGKSSNTKAKTIKSAKPAKKAVSKVVSKSVKKSSSIKKAVKSAKVIAPAKKKAPASKTKKIVKKVTKVVKPAKVAKPIDRKKVKPEVKSSKAVKPVKKAIQAQAVKASKPEEKEVKKAIAKEKELPKKVENGKSLANEKLPKVKKGKGGRKPKSQNDDDEPEIINDELIEQIIQTTKKSPKGPKKPRIIQTFVNPINSLTVALPADAQKKANAAKKEPKGKFELEYVVRTSAGILYELLTTPSGLSEWFADDVNIRDGIFTFFWDGSEQKARLLGFKEDKYVRLQWLDKPEGTYFEFRIERDELTGDISLMIVDFADEGSDQLTSKLLWDSQVNKLLNVLGSN